MAILLDVLLPGIDGWEVLRRLKADARLRDIPVVIVTVVDERDVGLALGAVDYLVKPIDRDALLASLGRLTLTTKVQSRSVRILVVDDEPATLDMLEQTLGEAGFEVTRATGGRLSRHGERSPVVLATERSKRSAVRHHGDPRHGGRAPQDSLGRRRPGPR